MLIAFCLSASFCFLYTESGILTFMKMKLWFWANVSVFVTYIWYDATTVDETYTHGKFKRVSIGTFISMCGAILLYYAKITSTGIWTCFVFLIMVAANVIVYVYKLLKLKFFA